ncbi:MAG TPA: hypothetical protein VMN38_12230 [Sphingomicrobium sp.]|nr:hypothetical protein [Sphingomicrobium sp.]
MIEHLRVSKTANFHRLARRMTNAAVDDLFRKVRASHPSASQNLFQHRRVHEDGAIWSAISFLYERPVAFLDVASTVRERVCGFMLMVEYRGHVAIFRSHVELPAGFVTRHLSRVPVDRVDAAVAQQDAVFEQIRLRNMSLARHAMRAKTFEADDLRDVVGPSAANRYVPQGYRVRAGEDHYSTTPSTGRIGQRSDRVDHMALIDYAKAVIANLAADGAAPASFIRRFARAISLADIEGARPTAFAVDVAGLVDAIYERAEFRLVREEGGETVALDKVATEAALAELDTVLEVRGDGRMLTLHIAGDDVTQGTIALNKTRIALRALAVPAGTELMIERTDQPVGADPNRMSLRSHIDRENLFILLFEDFSLAYIGGTLFRDDALVDGGTTLLGYLVTSPLLDLVVDEKGSFTEGHTAFDANSTFGAIVNGIAEGDEILVCDDLGDEWADFIGLSNSSMPRRISFYHGKHGNLSLGAKPFHVSVSQAMKNLQRMTLPDEEIPGKIASWNQNYVSGKGVNTAIPRVARGEPADLADAFARARGAPDSIRRAMIVTSSLSKGAVEASLVHIAAGGRPDPYFVQLYWLLLSYFSACTEMNAMGYVVCRA